MQGVIRDLDNSRLQTILKFGDMALEWLVKKVNVWSSYVDIYSLHLIGMYF